MKTGISTASMYLRKTTEDAAVAIKNLGAETAEIFYQTFYEYRPEFSKALAPSLEGLEVNSVHVVTGNFEPQLFSPSRRIRGDGFYWLDQVMRSAQLLKADKYTFHGRSGKPSLTEDFDWLAERLNEVIAFCSRYGVKLCLENVSWSLCNRPEVFKELKSRCPELLGAFDIKQARNSGYPYEKYINEMASAISHVHLSDVDKGGKIKLPGKGIYNFEEILKRLKGAGFDGNVLIEVYPDNYNGEEELKHSLEFLNEIIYKIS